MNAGRIADPVVAASVRRTIATVYQGLGRLAEAETLVPGDPAGAPRAGRPRERGDRRELERPGDHAHLPGKARLGRDGPRPGAGDPPRARRRGHRHGRDPARSLRPGQHEGRGSPGATRSPSEALAILRRVAGRARPRRGGGHGPGPVHPGLGAGELAKAESTGRAAAAMLRELGLERHPQMVPILSDLSITLANRGELHRGARDGAPDGGARLRAVRHLAPLPRHPSREPRLRLRPGRLRGQREDHGRSRCWRCGGRCSRTTTRRSAGPSSTSRRWSTTRGRTRAAEPLLRGGAAPDAAGLRAGAPRRGLCDRVAGAEPVLRRPARRGGAKYSVGR